MWLSLSEYVPGVESHPDLSRRGGVKAWIVFQGGTSSVMNHSVVSRLGRVGYTLRICRSRVESMAISPIKPRADQVQENGSLGRLIG